MKINYYFQYNFSMLPLKMNEVRIIPEPGRRMEGAVLHVNRKKLLLTPLSELIKGSRFKVSI